MASTMSKASVKATTETKSKEDEDTIEEFDPAKIFQMIITPENTPDYATLEQELMFEYDEEKLLGIALRLCNANETAFQRLHEKGLNSWKYIILQSGLSSCVRLFQMFGLNVYEQELLNFIEYKKDKEVVKKCEQLLHTYYVFLATFHRAPFAFRKVDDEIIFTKDSYTSNVYLKCEKIFDNIYKQIYDPDTDKTKEVAFSDRIMKLVKQKVKEARSAKKP